MIVNNHNVLPLLIPTYNGERITVIIQLSGGNDGLNTVIPIDQYSNYFNARSNIAIPEGSILPLNGTTGLHPSMTGIKNLYDNGKVAIIQNVGMPNPNGSHFRATDIWMSGSASNVIYQSGWQGRFLEGFPGNLANPPAIRVGKVSALLFQGIATDMGMTVGNPTDFYNFVNGITDPPPSTIVEAELQYIKQLVENTSQYSTVIRNAYLAAGSSPVSYPNTSIASQLNIVSKLIAGGLTTRVYLVTQDGYDTHSVQAENGSPTLGVHATLLQELSEAVVAFMNDIQYYNKANNVICMTFSEFGRRIKSNDSLGTDHGEAAPLFVIGNNVNPGIYGNNPIIPASPTISDNIPYQYDFRQVYTSVMEIWQGAQKPTADEVLAGDFDKIIFLSTSLPESTTTTTSTTYTTSSTTTTSSTSTTTTTTSTTTVPTTSTTTSTSSTTTTTTTTAAPTTTTTSSTSTTTTSTTLTPTTTSTTTRVPPEIVIPININNLLLHEVYRDPVTNEPLVMRVQTGFIYYHEGDQVFVPIKTLTDSSNRVTYG